MNRWHFLTLLVFSSFFCFGCLSDSAYLISNDPQKRIFHYANIYKLNPESDQARQAQLEIGKIYYDQLANPARGLEVFGKLIAANPVAPEAGEALWYISTHHFQEKEYDLACQKFLQFALDFSNDARSQVARLRVADCFFELRDLDSSAKYYRDYRKRYPDDLHNLPYVMLRIGMVYANQPGSFVQARKVFSQILKEFPNAMPHVALAREKLLDLGGITVGLSNVRELRAQSKVSPVDLIRQNSETGIGPLTRLDAQSTFDSWTKSETFGYNAKVLLQQSGMLDVAEVRNSMNGRGELLDDVVFNVGLRFYMVQDYYQAGACFEKTVELGIRESELYLKLGVCYRKVEEWGKATEAFRELAKVAPEDIGRLIDSSLREYRQGNREYGRKSLECLIGISEQFDGRINELLKE